MKRIPMIMAVALLVLTALPAVVQAQACGGYGQPACPPQPVRPAEAEGEIVETTPCSTIVVQGNSWGPGTTVYIDREFDGDCPGTGNPDDVLAEGDADDTRAAESAEVTVAEDGTFTAELLVPADAAGAYEVEVSGQGLDGTAKHQTYTYNVDPAANFVSDAAASPAAESDDTGTMALAAILAALILAVGFNWPSLVARVRR